MSHLDTEDIRKFYEDIPDVWPHDDMWHQYSRQTIEKYLLKSVKCNMDILNAGSGGNNYGLDFDMHHLDIAENKVNQFPKFSVASIEAMPFSNATFDCVICVGSVLNYCDAIKAISEITRVLLPSGMLFLEFESSWGYEHKGTGAYRKDAEIVTLRYNEQPHKQC